MPLARRVSQKSAARSPKNGTPDSHRGGGGNLRPVSEVVHSTIRSKLSRIVVIASQNGTTKTNSRAKAMTATASPRLFHKRRSTCNMIGQVATTKVVAQ